MLARCSGAVLVALLLAGCKAEPPGGSLLLSQVKQALADRDARLGSYRLEADVAQGEAQAAHAFFFRSPNKMRVVISRPAPLEWSFDGTQLYKLEPDEKAFSTYALKVPQEKAAMFLHTMFSPFVLEGFRTPLMPMKGVTATVIEHPKGPQAVELKLSPGEGVTVRYVLRWPSADFLERRTQTASGLSELKVEEEHCDAALNLCVPKRATELVDGTRRVTQLTAIELNAALPADGFTPQVPEGWTATTQSIVDDGRL